MARLETVVHGHGFVLRKNDLAVQVLWLIKYTRSMGVLVRIPALTGVSLSHSSLTIHFGKRERAVNVRKRYGGRKEGSKRGWEFTVFGFAAQIL